MVNAGEDRPFNSQVRSQWANPSDVLSLLLLVGGDVVQKALAQTAGRGFTPVAFSFGWVSYAFSALLTAVGDKRIMPDPDCSAIVVNTNSGYIRTNRSWIVGRIVRDVDHWMDGTSKVKIKTLIETAQSDETAKMQTRNKLLNLNEKLQRVPKKGLCVLIYRASRDDNSTVGFRDWMWLLSIAVLSAQLGIAAIPCGLYGQWEILLVTVCGTILAFGTTCLPQWFHEKWSCRRLEKRKIVALTQGNGAQHVIIIEGDVGSYDFEDLAASAAVPEVTTVAWFLCALVLWTALLITVSGIRSNTWYLVGVGAIGMLQNIVTAGVPRHPSTYGIHLEHIETIVHEKVMVALMKAELSCKKQLQKIGVANSLVKTFFPGDPWPSEKEWFKLDLSQQERLLDDQFWKQDKAGQMRSVERVKIQGSKSEVK